MPFVVYPEEHVISAIEKSRLILIKFALVYYRLEMAILAISNDNIHCENKRGKPCHFRAPAP